MGMKFFAKLSFEESKNWGVTARGVPSRRGFGTFAAVQKFGIGNEAKARCRRKKKKRAATRLYAPPQKTKKDTPFRVCP